MVQNSQSLYLFTFNALIIIHEYIYPHSTTKFTFKKYINSHLTTCFLFTNILTHIYEMYSFTFNGLYSFTFTIEILVQHGAIFIQHFLRITYAHYLGQNKDHDSSNCTNLAVYSVPGPEVFRTRYIFNIGGSSW